MKALPTIVKAKILNELSLRRFARLIAKRLHVGKSTVLELRQKFGANLPKPRSGRHSKLSPQDKHKMVMLIKTGRCNTAVDIQKEFQNLLGISVTSQTVRGVLKEA